MRTRIKCLLMCKHKHVLINHLNPNFKYLNEYHIVRCKIYSYKIINKQNKVLFKLHILLLYNQKTTNFSSLRHYTSKNVLVLIFYIIYQFKDFL